VAQEDTRQCQSTLPLPDRAPAPSPASGSEGEAPAASGAPCRSPPERAAPQESTPSARPSIPARREGPNNTDWIGWLIVLLAFLLVNCFLAIYCYWIFLPYPRW